MPENDLVDMAIMYLRSQHATRNADAVEQLRTLLHRWLNEASSVGIGPRAVLTQDTLDLVGEPSVADNNE